MFKASFSAGGLVVTCPKCLNFKIQLREMDRGRVCTPGVGWNQGETQSSLRTNKVHYLSFNISVLH